MYLKVTLLLNCFSYFIQHTKKFSNQYADDII